MESSGGCDVAETRERARGTQLVRHKRRNFRAFRQVVPSAVVQPAESGGAAPSVHSGGGQDDHKGARHSRKQMGHHLAPPPRPHRQRHQEPLELHSPPPSRGGVILLLIGVSAGETSSLFDTLHPFKKQCIEKENEEERVLSPVTTSLSLFPPGEKSEEEEEEEEQEEEEKEKEELFQVNVNVNQKVTDQNYFMQMMQRMIAEEVRNYMETLRNCQRNNGLSLEPGLDLLPPTLPK
ncbi:hypothetical protein glysoja_004186 [Glycine soja]|nr:hypothetical protein glysoja_004186 [Glycine soja]